MTREERNAVRGLAAKNDGDLGLAAAIFLGQELEYKTALSYQASTGSKGVYPDAFAASVGAIVTEVEQYTAADKESEPAKKAATK